MPPLLLLPLLFIGLPLAEIAVFIAVGEAIGVWPTLALVVLSAILGIACIRVQGFALVNRARRQIEAGEPPVFEMVSGLMLLLAGVLLVIPGFVTDSFGLALILPPVRRFLHERVIARHMTVTAASSTTGRPAGHHGPVVIEGEFETVDEPKGAMPPPRGGWDRPA